MDALTSEQLKKIMPTARGETAESFVDPLNQTMSEFSIDTEQRAACFLAQLAHESGALHYVKELASGEAYEGRKDLGNTESGDGVRYKGRGLIQITGRTNYGHCGEALGVDLIANPEKLEEPLLAARSAGWFWSTRKLNDWADKGDFRTITKRINGGFNGLDDRLAYYSRAREVYGLPPAEDNGDGDAETSDEV